MGKIQKITLVIRRTRTQEFMGEWRTTSKVNAPGYGKPTADNLKKWRDKFNQSCRSGGCNEHLGINGMINYQIEIYNQKTGEVLATYNPPLFECI